MNYSIYAYANSQKATHTSFQLSVFLEKTITIIFLVFVSLPRNENFGFLLRVINLTDIFCLIWCCFILLKIHNHIPKAYIPYLLLCGFMLVCTYKNTGTDDLKTCIRLVIRMLGAILLFEHLFVCFGNKSFLVISRVWSIFLIVQFYSLITRCFGYVSTNNSSNLPNYFFGIRNEINQYYLYSVTFSLIGFYLGGAADKFLAGICIASGIIFVISENVSTTIAGSLFFVFVFLMVFIIKSKKIWYLICLVLFFILIIFPLVHDLDFISWFIEGVLGKEMTLTGRTLIWNQAISQINGSHVVFGYGINPPFQLYTDELFVVNHPHNQYLQIIYNYGIPGFILFSIIIWKQISQIKFVKSNFIQAAFVAGLISTLIISLTSRTFFYISAQLFFSMAIHLEKIPKKSFLFKRGFKGVLGYNLEYEK